MKAILTVITEEMLGNKKDLVKALNDNFNAINNTMHDCHTILLQKFDDTEKDIRKIRTDMREMRADMGTMNTSISTINDNVNLILKHFEIPGGKQILKD